MIDIARVLTVLLGAATSEEPMSRLLALDEAAFTRRIRSRRSDSAGANVPGVEPGRAPVGVSA